MEHPERIMGSAGFFYEMGDVYASGYVAGLMKEERFRAFLEDALRKFEKSDYGDISRNDKDENNENKFLFGIERLFGRYGYELTDGEKERTGRYFEVICIRSHEGNIWVTADSEADWFLFLEEDQLPLVRDWVPEEED